MKYFFILVLFSVTQLTVALDNSYRDQAIFFDKHLLAGMASNNRQLLNEFDKPTVLNFWATWCYVCAAEMPQLVQAAEQNSNVNYVFINQYQSMKAVAAFEKKLQLTIPNSVINDGSKPALNAYAQALPVMVFLNKHGQIIATHRGKISAGDLALKTLLAKEN